MNNLHEQLSNIEFEMSNLTTFITQCMEKLHVKMLEYHELQRQLYIKDGLEKAQEYVDSLG